MYKIKVIPFLLCLLGQQLVFSQTFSSRITIDAISQGGDDFHCADFDNDGDLDIAVGFIDPTNKLVWYSNDGEENFGTPQVITTDLDRLRDIEIFDVDADGDIDLVSASQLDNKVVWYENPNNGENWTAHILTDKAG